jgi:hypothetical protein
VLYQFRMRLAEWVYWLLSPDKGPEIRPFPGATLEYGRCERTDEVVGTGMLHVESMHEKLFWARLYAPVGPDIVMWFSSKSPITLVAEED